MIAATCSNGMRHGDHDGLHLPELPGRLQELNWVARNLEKHLVIQPAVLNRQRLYSLFDKCHCEPFFGEAVSYIR